MLYSIGLFTAVVAPALVFAVPLADAYGLLKVATALLGSIILWTSCSGVRLRPSGYRGRGIELPLAALIGAFLWSWAASVDPIVGLLGVYGQPFYGAAALLPALVIFYAVHAKTRSQDHNGAFYCAAVICAAAGIVTASQLYGWTGSWERFGLIGVRAQGTFGSPPYAGAMIAPCLPPALWLAYRSPRWAPAAALGFLALFGAHSRGPILAAAVGLWAFAAASGAVRPRLRHLGLLAAILAALAAFYPGRIRADAGRLETWRIAARAGAEHPVAGWGPDAFVLANRALKSSASLSVMGSSDLQASAHNLPLQAWATLGLPGLLALLWLIGAGLYWKWDDSQWMAGWKDGGERPAAAFGALVAYLIASMTNPVPTMALYLVAAVMGASNGWVGRYGYVKSRMIWTATGLALILTTSAVGVQMLAETLHSFGNLAIQGRDINLGADLLRQANEFAPWDSNYAAGRCDLIHKLTEVFPKNRKEYERRALIAAYGAVKWHQQDPGAHELMSSVELRGAPIFGRGLARDAMMSAKRAHELDPLNEFSVIRWGQAAILVGDRREEKTAFARLKIISAMRK